MTLAKPCEPQGRRKKLDARIPPPSIEKPFFMPKSVTPDTREISQHEDVGLD